MHKALFGRGKPLPCGYRGKGLGLASSASPSTSSVAYGASFPSRGSLSPPPGEEQPPSVILPRGQNATSPAAPKASCLPFRHFCQGKNATSPAARKERGRPFRHFAQRAKCHLPHSLRERWRQGCSKSLPLEGKVARRSRAGGGGIIKARGREAPGHSFMERSEKSWRSQFMGGSPIHGVSLLPPPLRSNGGGKNTPQRWRQEKREPPVQLPQIAYICFSFCGAFCPWPGIIGP